MRHPPLHIFRNRRRNPVPLRADEVNPRLVQRNRLVAIVCHHQVHRHKSIRGVVHPEDLLHLFRVVRLRRNHHMLGGVLIIRGIRGGIVRNRHLVLCGHNRRGSAQRKNQQERKTQAHRIPHNHHFPIIILR